MPRGGRSKNKKYHHRHHDDKPHIPTEIVEEAAETDVFESREKKHIREEALIEGFGLEGEDDERLRSPDEVTILVTQEAKGVSGKARVLIQLDEARSTPKLVANSCRSAFQESTKRKWSYIYVVCLFVDVCMLGFAIKSTNENGIPVTVDSSSSTYRTFYSIGAIILISPLAFFMINLRLSNICLGVLWMYVIVSVQYFGATALADSLKYLQNYSDHATADTEAVNHTFDKVYQYMRNEYFKYNYILPAPTIFKKQSEIYACCDYKVSINVTDPKCKLPPSGGDNSSNTSPCATEEYESFWDAVFANFTFGKKATSGGSEDYKVRPEYCCESKLEFDGTCKKKNVASKYGGYTAGQDIYCDKYPLLNNAYTVMRLTFIFCILVEVMCLLMALVFWYYYSSLKAQEFAIEEQPGDFALLTIARPHIEGQKIELTIEEKLRRNRRRRKLSKLKKKYGIVDVKEDEDVEVEEAKPVISAPPTPEPSKKGKGKKKGEKK